MSRAVLAGVAIVAGLWLAVLLFETGDVDQPKPVTQTVVTLPAPDPLAPGGGTLEPGVP